MKLSIRSAGTASAAGFLLPLVLLLMLVATAHLATANYRHYETNAGPKEDATVNVHLVCHTHDDVGWLKTVDEYYLGANNTIQHAGVQYILDSVVRMLAENPDRKFIYVETAFFARWWHEQDDATRQQVKGLVENGQLEFINGGWCMNDEAATFYPAIIDQMSYGHVWLEREFGAKARPRIGWHIDPFGHSSVQASLFAQMGFDAFYFARIDYQDFDKRKQESGLETVWRGSRSLGKASDLFTGVTYWGYGPPPGFCFDQFCADPPINDDAEIFDDNVAERVELFVNRSLEIASHYRSSHVMMTMGSDFQYENAQEWYHNLDKLIHYVNQDGRVNVFYSTPSIYTDAVHAAQLEWSVKTDDFFPYADSPFSYWTGYFTSRPSQKGYTRFNNALLQACKQVEALSQEELKYSSDYMQRAMGVAQHHDGITGTEKQHVADDYYERMFIGASQCYNLMDDQLDRWVKVDAGSFSSCAELNVSRCDVTQANSQVAVVVWNSLSRSRHEFIRIPIFHSTYARVYDAEGREIESQVIANDVIANGYYDNQAGNSVVFEAIVKPMSYKVFLLDNSAPQQQDDDEESSPKQEGEEGEEEAANVVLDNGNLQVIFDAVTNRIATIRNLKSGLESQVSQQFFWYNASNFGNEESSQPSGAYIFRPNSTESFEVGNCTIVNTTSGPIVQAVYQQCGDWISSVTRLYQQADYVEMEWTVGPIPFQDDLGREVITRFTTDIDNNAVYYTDANGRDMQKRVRNYQPTYDVNVTQPVAGNYYPIDSAIYIQDATRRLTVLTDRANGGGSMQDGQLEIMIHRRLLYDDRRGVGEALNETGRNGDGLIVRGTHRILFEAPDQSNVGHRVGVLEVNNPLQPQFAPFDGNVAGYVQSHQMEQVFGTEALPLQGNLLTLQRVSLSDATMLLRLEHIFEVDEDVKYSQPYTVSLQELFSSLDVVEAQELSLSANQPIGDVHRLIWETVDGPTQPAKRFQQDLNITLNPMEIRTFLIKVQSKSSYPYIRIH